jgi:hypothetical protein
MMGYFVGDGWIQETKKKNSNRIYFTFQINFEKRFLLKNILPIQIKM